MSFCYLCMCDGGHFILPTLLWSNLSSKVADRLLVHSCSVVCLAISSHGASSNNMSSQKHWLAGPHGHLCCIQTLSIHVLVQDRSWIMDQILSGTCSGISDAPKPELDKMFYSTSSSRKTLILCIWFVTIFFSEYSVNFASDQARQTSQGYMGKFWSLFFHRKSVSSECLLISCHKNQILDRAKFNSELTIQYFPN